MKPGRNDPCPCGSGRKFKHCCLIAEVPQEPEDLVWRRIRRLRDEWQPQMFRFVADAYGPFAIDEAWRAFASPEEDPEFDPDTPHLMVFMPWWLHRWSPKAPATIVDDRTLHGVPPTRAFLERKGRRIDPFLREYLESCLEAPFSFFEVRGVVSGHDLLLRDCFTGEERPVLEQGASVTLPVGDLIYGQLARAQGLSLLEAAPILGLPPVHKIEVIELRARMRAAGEALGPDSLTRWDDALRELYLTKMESLLYPVAPQLQNTDREDILPHVVRFEIDSVQAAFDALQDLAFDETPEELLANGERGPGSRLVRVDLPWKKSGNAVHASWENTILGSIQLSEGCLEVEVNSAERATRIREIIEQRLGSGARHVETLELPFDPAMDQDDDDDADELDIDEALEVDEELDDELDEDVLADEVRLAQLPEVADTIKQFMAAHYESWVTTAIPALGGRTPLEAIQDPDGREMVEALVIDADRRHHDLWPGLDDAVLRGVRDRLGL